MKTSDFSKLASLSYTIGSGIATYKPGRFEDVIHSSGMAFVCSRAMYVVQLVQSAVMTPLMLLASLAFLLASPFLDKGLEQSFAALKAAGAGVAAIPLSLFSMILPVKTVVPIAEPVLDYLGSEDVRNDTYSYSAYHSGEATSSEY